MLSELVKRDFKKKYKRPYLGMIWSVLSPLLTLLVMSIVFKQFFGSRTEHYTIYLFCGNIVFSFFSDATNGGMASILNGDLAIIREVCAECGIDVANFNSPAQIVISGEKEKVSAACAMLKERGIRKAIELNVAGAFHSRLMADAGEKLQAVLAETAIKLPEIPVWHNYTAAVAGNVDELRDNLAKQVAGSVRWHECVQAMAAAGGDTMIEFGPGNVLTKLCSRALPEIAVFNVNSIASLEGINL